MVEQFHLSERRACRLVGLSRDSYRNPPVVDELTASLNGAIIDVAHARRRFGYRRIHDLLRQEFPNVNHKRVYRLYREPNLAVRRRAIGRCGLATGIRHNRRKSSQFAHPKRRASSDQAPGPISARAAHRVAIMIQRHGCPDRKAYDNASPASTAPTIGVHNMLRGAEVQDRPRRSAIAWVPAAVQRAVP